MALKHRHFLSPLLLIISGIWLLATSTKAIGGESYFLLMYGAQRKCPTPNYTHTWATFVRATWQGDGPCPVNAVLQETTISWLPVTGKVRDTALCPEAGRNYGLDETIAWCYQNEMRISLWGAYQIQPELHNAAVRQKALLDSGRVRYKAIDTGYSTDKVSNCIHAVSSVVEGSRLRVISPGWGETASFLVLQKLEPMIVEPGVIHGWVSSALGLDQYPIIYRDFTNPRSGAFQGPVNRLFGGENNLKATLGRP
jgi:hypothetical protein